MLNNQLIIYKNISEDSLVLKCLSFVDDKEVHINESEFIAYMLNLAENMNFMVIYFKVF